MSPVFLLNCVGTVAFAVAFILALSIPSANPAIGRGAKYTLLGAVGVFLFNSASNVLEYSGVTMALDVYGDYAKVLFVPLVVWSAFAKLNSERLLRARQEEAKHREQSDLLAGILETSPAGVIVADESGQVTFSSRPAERLLERAMPGQLDLASVVRSAPTTRLSVPIGPEGERSYLAVRAKALQSADGLPQRAVIALTDVSDRVKAERQIEEYQQGLEREIDRRTGELMEANRQLQSANDARQDFLAKMSHELRTPLNSIIGFSEVMLKGLSGPLTRDQEAQLGIVHSSGQHLLELVNDVLEISRIDAGYSPVSISRVDAGERMARLCASMGAIAANRDVDLQCACKGSTTVETDSEKLDQIVRNLISNAIKFTDAGGRVLVAVDGGRDSLLVRVTDSGIGIAAEDQQRIFGAFQQVESADGPVREGTGLGLTICRELCDSLGGTLTVDSTPGEGSTFTLTLPRQFPGNHVVL